MSEYLTGLFDFSNMWAWLVCYIEFQLSRCIFFFREEKSMLKEGTNSSRIIDYNLSA